MFKITSTLFNEIEEVTQYELDEFYDVGTIDRIALFFTHELGNGHYLDMSTLELVNDIMEGSHRLMRIRGNGLLADAIAFTYGTYDAHEITQKNKKMALVNGDFYFFTGWNYDFIDELFSNVGGRQGFLDKINNNR